jgi:hypothetical protein
MYSRSPKTPLFVTPIPYRTASAQILPQIKTHAIVFDKLKKGANLFLPGTGQARSTALA